MILTDRSIQRELYRRDRGEDRLKINPLLKPIQPASVDLRLSNRIIVPQGGHIIDPVLGLGTTDREKLFSVHHLLPGQVVNVCTLEWIEIPSYLVGILVGKSRYARFFLQVECAGYVDPGWKGRLTLELVNLGPDTFILRPGMVICQIRFETVTETPDHLYGDPVLHSHYQGSEGVRPGVAEQLDSGDASDPPE